jgi:hypothetical protein
LNKHYFSSIFRAEFVLFARHSCSVRRLNEKQERSRLGTPRGSRRGSFKIGKAEAAFKVKILYIRGEVGEET